MKVKIMIKKKLNVKVKKGPLGSSVGGACYPEYLIFLHTKA